MMHILMIAPQAPPKNSPEAIQVGRYLQELDKDHHITLVTTPIESGWVKEDKSLHFDLNNTEFVTLKLPFHKIAMRLLASRYCKWLSLPDKDFWLKSKAVRLSKSLRNKPDIIYSRSLPVSSATHAYELKNRLDVPWVMHLSDPWSDSPYLATDRIKNKLLTFEQIYFEAADAITVTTVGFAGHLKSKYPSFSKKVYVSPNVMPNTLPHPAKKKEGREKLTFLYAGAFYGLRRPTTILKALNHIRQERGNLLDCIEFKFVGNMTDDIRQEIDSYNLNNITVLGRRNFTEAQELQKAADIIISIEPGGGDPIFKTFLPSKVLDCIALRKPVLAITPENSETWRLCRLGYGWAVMPDEFKALAKIMEKLCQTSASDGVRLLNPELKPPEEYSAVCCVKKLNTLFNTIVNTS
jgi:glycosyltransferase involved in cell wall biosynthesis